MTESHPDHIKTSQHQERDRSQYAAINHRAAELAEQERQLHQKRLARWKDGPDMTAYSSVLAALEYYGVNLADMAQEARYHNRINTMSPIGQILSGGRRNGRIIAFETLPYGMPRFEAYLGKNNPSVLSVAHLHITPKVRLSATNEGTKLSLIGVGNIAQSIEAQVIGQPLTSLIGNQLPIDQISQLAITHIRQGKTTMHILLDDQKRTIVADRQDRSFVSRYRMVSDPYVDQDGTPHASVAEALKTAPIRTENARKDVKQHLSLVQIKRTNASGLTEHYVLIALYRNPSDLNVASENVNKEIQYGKALISRPHPKALWDNRIQCWALPIDYATPELIARWASQAKTISVNNPRMPPWGLPR